MRTARLRHVGAAPEDVDYRARRGLDKALFQQLLTGKWMRDKRNLMITGPCGVGKTWLACALAHAACRNGVTVLYRRLPRLFDELELAHGDGRFPRVFKSLTKTGLLILDDWGPDRLNASQRRDLMEIVEDRYGAGSILITSQLPIDTWHDVIAECCAAGSTPVCPPRPSQSSIRAPLTGWRGCRQAGSGSTRICARTQRFAFWRLNRRS
jgi:DNA replication protein DnaC